MWCENCGAPIPVGGTPMFCPNCGKPLTKKPSADTAGFGFASAGSLLGDDSPAAPMREMPPMKEVSHGAPTRPAVPVPPETSPKPVTPIKPVAPVKKPGFTSKMPFTPKASVAPPSGAAARRIPVDKELKLLLRQGWLVMLGEKRNLIFSLMFPVLAAAVTVWVAGKNMFDSMESTRSGCFVLVCAAIWCGLFNSIQTVVKERENIKRDYVSGALRIECYVASRAILQMLLCLVQSLVLVIAIPGVEWQYGNDLPNSGLIFPEPLIDYFISLFLVMYASDILGLLISSIVKKQELASQLAPYILIVQLLFSGVLFKMEGGAETISALMISRWGMEALGSISDLNDLPLKIMLENDNPMLEELIERDVESCFKATEGHLFEVWLIMLVFIVVQLVIANYCLHGVKKDTRS